MIYGLLFAAVMLAIVIIVLSSNNSQSPIIGGDKDEQGCLTSAGYSWNKDLQICVREWELKSDEIRNAVKLAADSIENKDSLTLSMINQKDCIGCYDLIFTDKTNTPFLVLIVNGQVENFNGEYCSADLRNADYCITLYEPVCGHDYNGEELTFSNSCFACSSEQIEYYINGECLE